ncbi:hypothetical protein BV372_14045 [Nostoc sp. T09]|uniref:nSTAND1 domain-containing NTPase n=1 Tax=Nostoc sp. T09 TaxID=1932621 RepID=UPI000B6FC8D3|nr:hypothetical protein [Nostoc sp. T09]OUL34355.1 hypothetical protein BV372_14045 [Nostoc sp. T09]
MTNDKINNDRALQQLAWAIQASVGQFKLMLAKCNYAQQRDRLIAKLQEISAVKISVLTLKPSQRTLYTAIREECGDNVQALMVVGLDKLQDLPQMLISANQVREEFRKSFPFPIVLWINDEIHQQMMQLAPDLESWATTKNFSIGTHELTDFLQQTATQLFEHSLNLHLEIISEIKSAWQELQNQRQDVGSELKANCNFLLGLVEYTNKNFDVAIEHYNQSLDYWRINNNFERQGKILSQITICYYEKTRKFQNNLLIRVENTDWETTRNYLQQSLVAFTDAERPDLIANSIDIFGIILRSFQDWEQLQILAEKALQLHQSENNQLKIAQDYGFLAEAALGKGDLRYSVIQEVLKSSSPSSQDKEDHTLAQANWHDAISLSKQALNILSTCLEVEGADKSLIFYHRSLYLLILAQAQQQLAEDAEAIANLELAIKIGVYDQEPQIYIEILNNLQRLYFQQKQYLDAFDAKLEARSIEQQFGLRAFIGAGRLQATKQVETQIITALQIDNLANIAPEIAASGRQLDVERLIERIGRPDYKLIVIHGQSGVGKSSLVNAGLVPALKRKAIGTQDNLVVAIRVYSNWVEELGRVLGKAGGVEAQEGEVKLEATGLDSRSYKFRMRQSKLFTRHSKFRTRQSKLFTRHSKFRTRQSELFTRHSKLRTRQFELFTRHSKLRTRQFELFTRHSKFRTRQSELFTQHSKLRTSNFPLLHLPSSPSFLTPPHSTAGKRTTQPANCVDF